MTLRLDDGTTIVDVTRPPQGMRHRVLFGTEESSGEAVAVKIELIPGTLETERLALEWLGANAGPAPRLLTASRVASPENHGAICLVSSRVDGNAPGSPAGWQRLGVALARLSEVPWEGCGLVVHDHRAFLAGHEERVSDLSAALGSDLGGRLPPVPRTYLDSPLTLTHGDPGPGNFLDDGSAGTIIDWEDAQVVPLGLDLARAAFIALLGAGPESYEARDHAARAEAVVTGYLAQRDGRSPGADERNWWLAVAGVQFAHRRLQRAGEPGVLPWTDAIDVLNAAPDLIRG